MQHVLVTHRFQKVFLMKRVLFVRGRQQTYRTLSFKSSEDMVRCFTEKCFRQKLFVSMANLHLSRFHLSIMCSFRENYI